MIAGTNHLDYCTPGCSFCFSKNKACWGWATWRRAWENMDFDLDWLHSVQKNDVFKNFGGKDSQYFWKTAIKAIQNGTVNTWDWQWYFSISLNNQLCIFPQKNLIANIGFGADATHTIGIPIAEFLRTEDIEFPLIKPKYIIPDMKFDYLFERKKLKKVNFINRIINKINRMLDNA